MLNLTKYLRLSNIWLLIYRVFQRLYKLYFLVEDTLSVPKYKIEKLIIVNFILKLTVDKNGTNVTSLIHFYLINLILMKTIFMNIIFKFDILKISKYALCRKNGLMLQD